MVEFDKEFDDFSNSNQPDTEYVSKVEATDPNGDSITFKLENAPEGLTIAEDGTLTWNTPVLGQYTVTVIVTDSEGAVARRQFQLKITDPNAVNTAPTLEGTLPGAIPVDKTFTTQLIAIDPEGDSITFKLVGGPDSMVISNTGRVEWTPTETGTFSFQVEISDGTNTAIYTCTLEVVAQRENKAPEFTSWPTTSLIANKQFTYKPTASDPDDDAVTITLVDGPAGMQMNAAGEIVWTPGKGTIGLFLRIVDNLSPQANVLSNPPPFRGCFPSSCSNSFISPLPTAIFRPAAGLSLVWFPKRLVETLVRRESRRRVVEQWH